MLQVTGWSARYVSFPKQCLHCRGSHGVAKGPLDPNSVRPCCRGAFCIVIYSTWWHLPSKTPREIYISGNFLHFSWEVYHFSCPGRFRSPGCLLAASWVRPAASRRFQMPREMPPDDPRCHLQKHPMGMMELFKYTIIWKNTIFLMTPAWDPKQLIFRTTLEETSWWGVTEEEPWRGVMEEES